MAKAEAIYEQLAREGYDVVLDDRDERPGVKFKDADLVGFPLRIVPGPRALEKGRVELVERASREKREIPLDEVPRAVREAAERLAMTRPR